MATGMAIMGFGGGAMIGSPLATLLMNSFKTPTDPGVWQTFIAMAAIYFVFMLIGAFGYRLPPAGWRPEGWTPPVRQQCDDHVRERAPAETRTRRRSSGACGWCCASTCRPESASSARPRPCCRRLSAARLDRVSRGSRFDQFTR